LHQSTTGILSLIAFIVHEFLHQHPQGTAIIKSPTRTKPTNQFLIAINAKFPSRQKKNLDITLLFISREKSSRAPNVIKSSKQNSFLKFISKSIQRKKSNAKTADSNLLINPD
jgi:hypothetical protein